MSPSSAMGCVLEDKQELEISMIDIRLHFRCHARLKERITK